VRPIDRRNVLSLLSRVSAYIVRGLPGLDLASMTRRNLDQSQPLNVTSFREKSDLDDTASFVRALKRGSKIFVPQGKGSGPGGIYYVSRLALPSHAEISGEGHSSILKPATPELSPCILVESQIGEGPIAGILIRNLAFEGHSLEKGFSEHRHLVNLNGVNNVRLLGLGFRGFQGDAIYLGTGPDFHGHRSNRNIVIHGCFFDGLNHQNRNAISVIDGVEVQISNCRFQNCTRCDMPGPIDFEPNHPGLEKVGQIRIRNCTFQNCGGMAGQITIIAPDAEISFVEFAIVETNKFQNYMGVGSDIHVDVRPPMDWRQKPLHKIVIRNNVGKAGNRPVVCKAGAAIELTRIMLMLLSSALRAVRRFKVLYCQISTTKLACRS
jgi:hypothetical protein